MTFVEANGVFKEVAAPDGHSVLEIAHEMEITDIVIPCIDQSSISNLTALDLFKRQILCVVPIAEKLGVNLSLETDLSPQVFKQLLVDLNSTSITVNYDTGNSASLGYDFYEELSAYGKKITDLHIKDRTFRAGSVFLGEGDVDFKAFFNEFRKLNFNGPLIMQVYRDDEGVSVFKDQLNLFHGIFQ